MRRKDLAGLRFGRLVALNFAGTFNGKSNWVCRCDCGGMKTATTGNLIRGGTRSCGCLFREVLAAHSVKHGGCGTDEHRIWQAMMTRCRNANASSYKNYGGRGITVCAEWADFRQFLSDMGPRPSKRHSLDRIDNYGNYEPNNCRWATDLEQARNTRANVVIEFNGEMRCITAWAEHFNISFERIYSWRRRGMDIAQQLSLLGEA